MLVLLPLTLGGVGLEALGIWGNLSWLYVAGAGVGALALPVYSTVLHWKRGQTFGKRVAGVKVVDEQTGGPLRLSQAFLRSAIDFAYSAALAMTAVLAVRGGLHWNDLGASDTAFTVASDWVFSVWFCLELLSALTNERRRALHDLIAGTVVVKVATIERDTFKVEVVPGGSGAAGW